MPHPDWYRTEQELTAAAFLNPAYLTLSDTDLQQLRRQGPAMGSPGPGAAGAQSAHTNVGEIWWDIHQGGQSWIFWITDNGCANGLLYSIYQMPGTDANGQGGWNDQESSGFEFNSSGCHSMLQYWDWYLHGAFIDCGTDAGSPCSWTMPGTDANGQGGWNDQVSSLYFSANYFT